MNGSSENPFTNSKFISRNRDEFLKLQDGKPQGADNFWYQFDARNLRTAASVQMWISDPGELTNLRNTIGSGSPMKAKSRNRVSELEYLFRYTKGASLRFVLVLELQFSLSDLQIGQVAQSPATKSFDRISHSLAIGGNSIWDS